MFGVNSSLAYGHINPQKRYSLLSSANYFYTHSLHFSKCRLQEARLLTLDGLWTFLNQFCYMLQVPGQICEFVKPFRFYTLAQLILKCFRTSTRPVPPTNLKDRIAALQHRTAGGDSGRPVSPTSNATGGVQSGNALRDKIAKFEKKGGIPVPRGSFGLGAPPSADGPRRQGELYGNRIPAPAKSLSAQYTGGSRASSPIGSFVDPNARRSFSTSSVTGDFDDGCFDNSPMSSPSLTFSPDTPNSLSSSSEASPTHSTARDAYKRPLYRGTSFHEAMEIARKVEAAKLATIILQTKTIDSADSNGEVAESPIIPTIAPQPLGNLGPMEDNITTSVLSKVPIIHESSNHPSKMPSGESPPSIKLLDTTVEPSLENFPSTVALDSDAGTSKGSLPSSFSERPLSIGKRSQTEASAKKPEDDNTPMSCNIGSKVPLERTNVVDLESMPSGHPVVPSIDGHEPRSSVESSETVIAVQQITEVKETQPCGKSHDVLHSKATAFFTLGGDTEKDASFHTSITFDDVGAETNKTDICEPSVAKSKESTSREINSADGVNDPEISLHNTGIDVSPSTVDKRDDGFPIGKSETTLLISKLRESIPDRSVNGQGHISRTGPPIQPPDPSSSLSPPPSSFLSGVVSNESPYPSPASSNSRPYSMLSPAEVSRALRMTPATSRGVPMFLPPNNTQPRKSDFVYIPPSPEDERNVAFKEDTDEFGVLAFGHHRHGSESDLTGTSTSDFKAVVHRKVTEIRSATVPAKTWVVPETPDKRATILQTPLSPGHEELAALLQEAMMLEDTLNKKVLPGEAGVDEHTKPTPEKHDEGVAKQRDEEEERRRIAYATAQLQSKRDMPTQGRLKHTFLMPLSKVKAMHRKESTVANRPISQQEDFTQPKSAELPVQPGLSNATVQIGQGLTGETQHPRTSQASTRKSLKSPRFPSFKRFGSISLSNNSSAPLPSNSTSSEISSEDSNLIVTPPDKTLDFGEPEGFDNDRVLDLSLTFPSLSPKKSTSSIVRAASLAEKLWSRARTRSNGSILSSSSILTREDHLFNDKCVLLKL